MQIIIFGVFIASAVFILLEIASQEINAFVMFLLAELLAFITDILFYSTFNAPTFLRKRYGLTTERFHSFHQKI